MGQWNTSQVPSIIKDGFLSALPWLLIVAGLAIATGIVILAMKQFQKRQVREQRFINAIDMASDSGNDARVCAGFVQLRHLLGESANADEKGHLLAARSVAESILERADRKGEQVDAQVRLEASRFLRSFPPD